VTDRPELPATTEIVAREAVLDCFLVPWDSAIFGFPVAQIGRIDLGVDGDAVGLLLAFEAWCADRDVRLVSCRLDHERLRESMALEDHGFRFVEMVYQPRRSLEGIAAPRAAVDVGVASPSDLESIESIAYTAFTTGRFLIDQRLTPELSKRRYASWVRTSFETPSHEVIKAEVEGELVGFFIVEHRPDGSVYWHLTAIAPRWQGKGVGLDLWTTMLLRHQSEGATTVETTISAHNTAAMNLYARLGFTFSAAQMTLHWLRDRAVGGGR
jgi:RimJ/RimL family protein N-acetyltransferase